MVEATRAQDIRDCHFYAAIAAAKDGQAHALLARGRIRLDHINTVSCAVIVVDGPPEHNARRKPD